MNIKSPINNLFLYIYINQNFVVHLYLTYPNSRLVGVFKSVARSTSQCMSSNRKKASKEAWNVASFLLTFTKSIPTTYSENKVIQKDKIGSEGQTKVENYLIFATFHLIRLLS